MADLVERLRVRWEATDEPVAKKVNRFIKERKEAADAIEAKDRKIAELHAALTTAAPHMPVPAGWVLVLEEPTREMWAAMADTLYGYKNRHHDKVVGDLWRAMLASRPKGGA